MPHESRSDIALACALLCSACGDDDPALDTDPGLTTTTMTTEGGAAIDQDFHVLDPSGNPIPGLYAVGQNGLGGMILWGHGLHIAWALTSGRLAGQAIMRSNRAELG